MNFFGYSRFIMCCRCVGRLSDSCRQRVVGGRATGRIQRQHAVFLLARRQHAPVRWRQHPARLRAAARRPLRQHRERRSRLPLADEALSRQRSLSLMTQLI